MGYLCIKNGKRENSKLIFKVIKVVPFKSINKDHESLTGKPGTLILRR